MLEASNQDGKGQANEAEADKLQSLAANLQEIPSLHPGEGSLFQIAICFS